MRSASLVAADGPPDPRPLVVSIVGTRPEAIKMAPVIRALRQRLSLRQQVLLTGQHSGLESSIDGGDVPLTCLGINPTEQTAGEIRESIHLALLRRFVLGRPALVLVQGDTSSALGGALAAWDAGVPIGHVEAGLRSGDPYEPWPEEQNRILIDELSDLLFAPTETAAANLADEPRVRGCVFVTGNTGIDALLHARLSCPAAAPASERKTILVTCHRRENQGDGLRALAATLKELAHELPVRIVFLLHPNPHLRAAVERLLAGEENIVLSAPLDHSEMVAAMQSAWLILTDSGGIQEEAPALGRAVLVLRRRTERPEALATHNLELVGTDGARLFEAVRRLIAQPRLHARMSRPSFPFGDGQAAPRIARIVEDYLLARAAPSEPKIPIHD